MVWLLPKLSHAQEFQVNVTTANTQQNAAVATNASGTFLVAWESAEQDSDGYGIYAQLYSAPRNVTVAEFKVNNTTTNDVIPFI